MFRRYPTAVGLVYVLRYHEARLRADQWPVHHRTDFMMAPVPAMIMITARDVVTSYPSALGACSEGSTYFSGLLT